MTWMRDMSRSIRDNAILTLVDRFTNAVDATGNPFWSIVSRSDLRGEQRHYGTVMTLLDDKERKEYEMAEVVCHLRLVTAFSQIADSTLTDGVIGFDPADELNRLLTAVQLTIAEDRTCSGLVCDILEVQNEIDATGRGSSLVEGAIQWDVVYRHALDDPRRFIGET